jgi:hypothetical protein
MSVEQVELNELDLRYESLRMRNRKQEEALLVSMSHVGLRDALCGVEVAGVRVLLDGFKRLRCARKLGLGVVGYCSLGTDVGAAIAQLLAASRRQGLTVLEEAAFVDELRVLRGLSVADIALELSRSKGWVSMRMGLIGQMSSLVRASVFGGRFPAYAYMMLMRRFMRMNNVKQGEMDSFVKALGGQALSFRDIELLAHGYFRGPPSFREQVDAGHLGSLLEHSRGLVKDPEGASSFESGMLGHLEQVLKHMQRAAGKSADPRLNSRAFHVQAHVLLSSILPIGTSFFETMRRLYDQCTNAHDDIRAASAGSSSPGDCPADAGEPQDG